MTQRSEQLKAKLFNLNDDSEWEELGVGYPTVEKKEDKYYFIVYKEGDDKVLYQHEFLQDTDMTYEQTEEKVISYNSDEKNLDMAVSFQNEVGAKLIWDKIKEAEQLVKDTDGQEDDFYGYLENEVDMSYPTFNNLTTILKELQQLPLDRKSNLSIMLSSHPQYLKKMTEIFNKAESQKDEDKLKDLCQIIKLIIQYGEHELYEILLNDTYYLTIFGMLEYDTDVFQKQTITHRQFLKGQCKFHQVIDMKDDSKIEKIHFNYRLQYLKDCALGHYLDDRANSTIQMISQRIYFDLISFIANTKDMLGQLTEKLRNLDLRALRFMHELFSALKSIDKQKQEIVLCFQDVSAFEILIEDIFQNTKGEKKVQYSLIQKKKSIKLNSVQLKEAQLLCYEILSMSQAYAPQCLQQYTLAESQRYQKYPFLKFLIENIVNNQDPIRQNQCSDILKGLISISSEQQQNEYTFEVSQLIADNFTNQLLVVFEDQKMNDTEDYARILRTVLEIFTQLIKNHNLMDTVTDLDKKEYLEKLSGVIEQSIKVFKLRCKYVIIKALNIYKKFCECKNEVIFKKLQITPQYILKYVFEKLGRRQNLIFSEILSLVTSAHVNDEKNNTGQNLTFYSTFEEDILLYRKNKNYNFIKKLLFQEITKGQDKDLHLASKKNSECMSENYRDIDLLPQIPKTIQNIPINKENQENVNNKRVNQLADLVNYEEDDEDENDLEKIEKKVNTGYINDSRENNQYKFPQVMQEENKQPK